MEKRPRLFRRAFASTSRSLLWRYLAMIISVLLISIAAALLILAISVSKLRNDDLERIRLSLDQSTEQMESSLYNTTVLASITEQSVYYEYIKMERSGSLDKKYYPVMAYFQQILLSQISIRGNSDATLLYFSGVNSVVGTKGIYPAAEACFQDSYQYESTQVDTILEHLRRKNGIVLLPAEQVTIHGENSGKYLTCIVHPLDKNVAVMTLYSEAAILEALEYSMMPEGTVIEIRANNTVLLHAGSGNINSRDYHELTARMPILSATVHAYIPRSYLVQQIISAETISIAIIALTFAVGVCMAFYISISAVKPLREILKAHEQDDYTGSNELEKITHILDEGKSKNQALTIMVAEQILARGLSGTILSPADERMLIRANLFPKQLYYVAIIHTGIEINAQLGTYFQEKGGFCHHAIINRKETGFLIDGNKKCLLQFTDLIDQFNKSCAPNDQSLFCGISTLIEGIENIHIGTHQARVSMPKTPGCSMFTGTIYSQGIDWIQCERFYQCMFSIDLESSNQFLHKIMESVNSLNGREIFYAVRLVLRSAAEEMGIALEELDSLEYNPRDLPLENMNQLQNVLQKLHKQMMNQKNRQTEEQSDAILKYIGDNMHDSNLCAAMVAEAFHVSEKWIYETVRRTKQKSFGEYLLDLRMKRAAKLLLTTRDSIGQITQACGYTGSSTFYRLFKKYYGVPPGQYREDPDTSKPRDQTPGQNE